MLAGRMKLTHFMLIAGGIALAGGIAVVAMYESPEPSVPVINVLAPGPVAAPTPTQSPAPSIPDTPAISVSDQAEAVVRSYVGKDLKSAKLKDVTKSKAFKVNVYQDDDNTTANRAKVDLDRDDSWDQKYTFHDDGSISRKTSTSDDETYDVEEVLD